MKFTASALTETDLTPLDIFCGKDRTLQHQPGNVRFTKFIRERFQLYYTKMSKNDKMEMTKNIVEKLKNDGSRFLAKNPEGQWQEITDASARDKVSHALRTANKASQKACAITITAKSLLSLRNPSRKHTIESRSSSSTTDSEEYESEGTAKSREASFVEAVESGGREASVAEAVESGEGREASVVEMIESGGREASVVETVQSREGREASVMEMVQSGGGREALVMETVESGEGREALVMETVQSGEGREASVVEMVQSGEGREASVVAGEGREASVVETVEFGEGHEPPAAKQESKNSDTLYPRQPQSYFSRLWSWSNLGKAANLPR